MPHSIVKLPLTVIVVDEPIVRGPIAKAFLVDPIVVFSETL